MLNLTPHTITLRAPQGDTVLLPSGTVARVATSEEVVEELEGMLVIRRTLGEATGLPEEGVACLVSSMVLAAVPGRRGVYAPDTGPTAVREDGRVVAVTRLVKA